MVTASEFIEFSQKFWDGIRLTGEDARIFLEDIAKRFNCTIDEAMCIFLTDMQEIGADVLVEL